MGYLAILIGFALVTILVVKRWTPVIVCIIAASVCILLNGLPYGETMNNVYFAGLSSMVKSIFPCLFAGSLIAQVYSRTGAVNSLGDTMANLLFKEGSSQTRNYISCVLACVLTAGVLAYSGMNSLVTIIALYPIAMRLFERAGVPKKFVMGPLNCVYTFGVALPGSVQIANVLGMQQLETPSYAGLVGGIIGMIAEIIVILLIMTWMIKKDVAKGGAFAYGSTDVIADDEKERPKAIITLIPLAALIIAFNVFGIEIFTASMIGFILATILFWKYLPAREESKITELKDVCSAAFIQGVTPAIMVGSMVGFTSVLQALPEYQRMIDAVFATNVSPVILLLLAVSFIAFITGSSSSAMRIGMPIAISHCQAAGFSNAFIHRVSAFTATILDTMPWASSQLINLSISGLDVKDCYPSCFVTTVIAPAVGALVCVIVMRILPFVI